MIKRQRQKCILSLHEPGFPDSGKMTGIGQIYVTMRVFKVCFLRSFWNEDARYVKVTSQKRSLRERKIATHQNKDLFSFLKIPLVPTPPLPLAWLGLLMTQWPSKFHSDLAQLCILCYLDSSILLGPHISVCQMKCHFLLSMGYELLVSRGHSEKNSFSPSSRWWTLPALN